MCEEVRVGNGDRHIVLSVVKICDLHDRYLPESLCSVGNYLPLTVYIFVAVIGVNEIVLAVPVFARHRDDYRAAGVGGRAYHIEAGAVEAELRRCVVAAGDSHLVSAAERELRHIFVSIVVTVNVGSHISDAVSVLIPVLDFSAVGRPLAADTVKRDETVKVVLIVNRRRGDDGYILVCRYRRSLDVEGNVKFDNLCSAYRGGQDVLKTRVTRRGGIDETDCPVLTCGCKRHALYILCSVNTCVKQPAYGHRKTEVNNICH